jgi:hypothetical protein
MYIQFKKEVNFLNLKLEKKKDQTDKKGLRFQIYCIY